MPPGLVDLKVFFNSMPLTMLRDGLSATSSTAIVFHCYCINCVFDLAFGASLNILLYLALSHIERNQTTKYHNISIYLPIFFRQKYAEIYRNMY